MSAHVEGLNLLRLGGLVYAKLPCIVCDGIGMVEVNAGTAHSASIDPPSGTEVECSMCGGLGSRVLESTHPDFTAAWSELYGFTQAERDEADRILCELEDEATAFAIQESRKPQDYTGALDRIASRLERDGAVSLPAGSDRSKG